MEDQQAFSDFYSGPFRGPPVAPRCALLKISLQALICSAVLVLVTDISRISCSLYLTFSSPLAPTFV